MNLVCVVLAVLCGLALVFEFDTGSLGSTDVAGFGIIFAAMAALAPGGWPWRS
mgnify:CR=1 FL=1